MISYFNTVDDIIASGVDTAILPIGSVEQHSSHLPTGTDYIIADALSKGIAEKLDAYLLPALPISTCMEHKGKKGSVWMRPTTLITMIEDIVICLKNQGFKKVIILVTHGGIFALGPAIRELNSMNDDLKVIKLEAAYSKEIDELIETYSYDIHAGEAETSLMLYICREHVKEDLMIQNDCVPDCPREYLNYASLLKLSRNGVWGKPSLASYEKGEKVFSLMIDAYLEYIKKAFDNMDYNAW